MKNSNANKFLQNSILYFSYYVRTVITMLILNAIRKKFKRKTH